MYKLTDNGVLFLDKNSFIPANENNGDWKKYLAWLAAGNTPLPADTLTPDEIARQDELEQAPETAKQYFLDHPAAISFIRLTPAEQEAAIDGMTLAQLKTVVKHLTIATSALVKWHYLS